MAILMRARLRGRDAFYERVAWGFAARLGRGGPPLNASLFSRLIDAVWWVHAYQWVLGAAAAAGLFFFGGHGNAPLFLALNLMLIDLISGLVKAVSWQALTSEIAYRGLQKKLAMLIAIMAGHTVDHWFNAGDVGKATMAYYVAGVEMVSIFENIAATGLVLPEHLQNFLRAFISNPDRVRQAETHPPPTQAPPPLPSSSDPKP